MVSSSPDVIELFPRRIDDADRLVEIRAGAVVPSLALVRTPGRKIVKNRVHLDVTPIDRSHDAEVERLLALGATRVDGGQSGEES